MIMMTVREVSRLTGVSVRALQYYDRIGLLRPAQYTDAGYRLYDGKALETLQQIMLFRELEFPLKDIKSIISSPAFDREAALTQQIELLTLKKEHIEKLIALAREIRSGEVESLKFDAFNTEKMEEYAARAKAYWGETPAYREYEEKADGRTEVENRALSGQMMDIFSEFGTVRNGSPASPEAQELVRKLQVFITEHYYNCTEEILGGLGKMYANAGEFRDNIDRCGGEGTAEFVHAAIEIFVGK